VSPSSSTFRVVPFPGLLVEPVSLQIQCKDKRCRAPIRCRVASHPYFLEIPTNPERLGELK
jgi:hypothetical protein